VHCSLSNYLRAVTPLATGALHELLEEGWLFKLLRKALDERDTECLTACWTDLEDEHWPASLGNYFEPLTTSFPLSPKELQRLLEALFATCAAATCFQLKWPNELAEWLKRSAWLLDDPNSKAPPIPQTFPTTLDQYIEFLVEQRWQIPAALHWTRWWLGEQSKGHRIEVPMAGVIRSDGTDSGWITNVHFERLPGAGHRLIPHPESALYPVKADFMEPIGHIAAVCDFPVCWGITCPQDLPYKQRAFSGNSAGGAVARALWHLHGGKFADPGVLVLASVQTWPEWFHSGKWEELTLKPVNKTAAKIRNASDDPSICTIIQAVDGGKLSILDRTPSGWKERASADSTSAA
jgi:hypothetical protein